MKKFNILIVEDDIMICQDLREQLELMNYNISGVAYDFDRALLQLSNNLPDLVLLDINLGSGKDGIDLAHVINKTYRIPFIFLTSYANHSVVSRAKECRPSGYIVKPFTEKDIFANVEIALFNKSNKPKKISWDLQIINQKCQAKFTPKEALILKDIFEGKTNRQLCEKHFISLNTIKTHVLRIYEKLEVHSRSEAMAAIRERMLQPE